MQANQIRIQQHLEALAQFNATPGQGVTRLSYSAEDQQARAYIKQQMQQVGLQVSEDAIGNIWGRLDGNHPDRPAIVMGSHFDTVPHGGAFDGQAGVVMALEIAALFHEQKLKPNYPLEFVALVEEEGTSFGAGLLASRTIAGLVSYQDLEQLRDRQGNSAAQRMQDAGFAPQDLAKAVRRADSNKAFLELHIEQGPVLEQAGEDIGIVDTIVGLTQLIVTVQGKAGHAGTTPMHMRADALLASSGVIQQIAQLANQLGECVATVGKLQVMPNGSNVIPGRVEFTVDIRAKDSQKLQQLVGAIKAAILALNSATIQASIAQPVAVEPVAMDQAICQLFAEACGKLGLKYRQMVSGAGHDAMVFAKLAPTGLIFVPSRDGLSHHPDEWTDYAQIQQGVEVIFETVKQLAEVV